MLEKNDCRTCAWFNKDFLLREPCANPRWSEQRMPLGVLLPGTVCWASEEEAKEIKFQVELEQKSW